jgi:hypothetical protein
VIQEAVLAKSTVVYRGQWCMTWFDLARASSWLAVVQPPAIDGFMPLSVLNIVGIREALRARDRLLKLAGSETAVNLQTLLLQTRWNKATDPRDKIFGLLGEAMRTGSVVADCSKSVLDVYIETALALIQSMKIWKCLA